MISRTSSNFSQIQPRTADIAALKRLKKLPWIYNGENLVSTLAQLFSIGSSSFLRVTRTTIGRTLSLTSELATLERLKKRHIILLAL